MSEQDLARQAESAVTYVADRVDDGGLLLEMIEQAGPATALVMALGAADDQGLALPPAVLTAAEAVAASLPAGDRDGDELRAFQRRRPAA